MEKFKRFRNIISHKYEKVDKELIWKFIEKKMPELKKILLKIREKL